MPGYKFNDIAQKAKAQADKVKRAVPRTADTDPKILKSLDAALMKPIEKMAKQAEKDFRKNQEVVKKNVSEAKGYMDTAKKVIARKKFGDAELKMILKCETEIKKRRKIIHEDNLAIAAALTPEFRKDAWIKEMRKILTDQKLLDPLQNIRKQQISDKSTPKLSARSKEYVERINALAKEAKVKAKEGNQIDQMWKDLKEIGKVLGKTHDNFATSHHNTMNKLDNIKKINPKKPPNEAVKKHTLASFPHVFAEAKKYRGSLKTMKIKLESLKRRTKGAPNFVKIHKAELAQAEKYVSAVEKMSTDLDKKVKETDKHMKKIA